MIKHILAVVGVALAIFASWYMIGLDSKVDKLNKISSLLERTKMEPKVKKAEPTTVKVAKQDAIKAQNKEDDDAQQKLKALKDRAGSAMAFKVSPLYKQKCSSCHGVNGAGIIGPKLVGLKSDTVYQDLLDFKSGKRKNYVMYGLLSKMEDDKLKSLSDEIGTFEQKAKEAK